MQMVDTRNHSPSPWGAQALLSLPRAQGRKQEPAWGLSGVQKQSLVPNHLASFEDPWGTYVPQQEVRWHVGK